MSSAQKIIQAAAGNAAGEGLAVEDVFSTYVYTGNGSTQTITNGIDLAGEGGLVWTKGRSMTTHHVLYDTERGVQEMLETSTSDPETENTDGLISFNEDGYEIDDDSGGNTNTINYVSWTFRKALKFFDVVTYTGDGTASRTISHNLGSAPGVLILKNTSNSSSWSVFHRSLGVSQTLLLEDTTGSFGASGRFGSSAPTATTFDINNIYNTNGETYVAYLFAHNDGDGEFGEDADQDIIKCGSYTGNGTAGLEIDLGFEPQWILVKRTDTTESWAMFDTMRGWNVSQQKILEAQSSSQELDFETQYAGVPFGEPTATGFRLTSGSSTTNASSGDYIYIAIRRGPMKTPESGTEVFAPVTRDSSVGGVNYYTGFPVDLAIFNARTAPGHFWGPRLTDPNRLTSTSTAAESSVATLADAFDTNVGYQPGTSSTTTNALVWAFRRAPGFFDVVAYEGTGYAATDNGLASKSHNLGVEPEMIIVKSRDDTDNWLVYHKYSADPDHTATYGTRSIDTRLFLNLTDASSLDEEFMGDETYPPTDTVFRVRSNNGALNTSGEDYIAYLFATLPGVSKVGSYTGNGSSQTIDCGFSTGARFFLVKASSTTGDWHVFDTERGIIAGNDPYLELNTTNAEDTDEDAVDPDSSGIIVNETSASNINTSGVTYIFLAIA